MRHALAVVLLFASVAAAEPPVQFDGGINVFQDLKISADDGTFVTMRAGSYGTTPGYLEIDGYVYTPYYIFSDSITFVEDDSLLSWPTGYGALGFNPGASTLGTVFIFTPYSLHVERTLDAGMILEKGEPVVLAHGANVAIESFADQLSAGTKSLSFREAFSSSAVACTCSDTDAPKTGCGPTSVSTSGVTIGGCAGHHFNAICVGPR